MSFTDRIFLGTSKPNIDRIYNPYHSLFARLFVIRNLFFNGNIFVTNCPRERAVQKAKFVYHALIHATEAVIGDKLPEFFGFLVTV